MRAMVLLVLLLAILALFSFYEPLAPYWKSRFPAVMACLDEGRYSDALAAAMTGTPPGEESPYWKKSEPLGEAAPVEEPASGEGTAPAEQPVPEEDPTPAEAVEPGEEAVSDM